MAWFILGICLAAIAALLVYSQWSTERTEKAIVERLQGANVNTAPETLAWYQRALQYAAQSRMTQRLLGVDQETSILLNRLGWRRSNQHSMYIASQWLLPLLLLLLALTVQIAFGLNQEKPLILPIFALGIGYLLPKRLLAMAASRHQEQLAKEISIFLPLLRILFDAGLTVEQALRVLSEQGQKMMPVLSRELQFVLRRVDSGIELSEELKHSGQVMAVDEYSDCLVILVQLLQQGGGALSSLLALKKQMDARRLTTLQEYISKLSGKMSVVMMVFLFPALLIVLAGPGLSAIGRALGG